jgi:hypothetical protein
MLPEETILALTPVTTFQDLGEGDGAVLLRTDSGQLYTCNDTTVALLRRIDGARPFGELVDLIHEEFDVDREELIADLVEVIADLEREGLLEKAPGSR